MVGFSSSVAGVICLVKQHLVWIYALFTVITLGSLINPFLASLATHGKTRRQQEDGNYIRRKTTITDDKHRKNQETRTTTTRKARNSSNTTNTCQGIRQSLDYVLDIVRTRLLVPKRFFGHFYVVGLVALTTAVIFQSTTTTKGEAATAYSYHPQHTVVVIALLYAHLLRRLVECHWVHRWSSSSRMHLAGYGVGILHYLVLPLVFVDISYCGDAEDETTTRMRTTPRGWSESPSTFCMTLRIFAAAAFNLWAQYQQHRHHVLLADLRRPPASATPERAARSTSAATTCHHHHPLPNTAWFRYVSCPHYLAEILLYVSLMVLQPTRRSAALFMWVTVNLMVSASQSHAWYVQQEQDNDVGGQRRRPFRHRKAIIPWVL
jgi:3-oxo-5-alpha-steroid 4-dehydrogenase 3